MVATAETYRVKAFCGNCCRTQTVDVKKGELVKNWLCPRCATKSLVSIPTNKPKGID